VFVIAGGAEDTGKVWEGVMLKIPLIPDSKKGLTPI
jgi:hypothetical protein